MNIKTRNRIKTVLAKHGKTSRWLAERVGKNEATISRWCTNRNQPTYETFKEIAKELNIDMDDLLLPIKKNNSQ